MVTGARRVLFCADDFGQSEAVDAGILRLARAGRLGAVSCLSGGAAFARDAPALLATGAAAGLHLDLTEGTDGVPPIGLGRLVVRSYLAALDREVLRRRVVAQLDAFTGVAGGPPAFVDGHRHAHQLPVVRGVLLRELLRRWPEAPPLVRVTAPRRWRGPKAAVIAALGGRALRRALGRAGVPHNADFAGVYGFDQGIPYRARVRAWLGSIEDGGLLMCHPGEASDDVISAARVAELAYLSSDAFEADCIAAGVVRVGLRELPGAVTLPCA
jgi:predicted glycoside hydrolase/deacetylase ChbG (UPF0249 family)